jgi:hypothetical protein
MAGETLSHDVTGLSQVRVFVPPRRDLYLAVGCLLFFLAATLSSIWVALANADGSFAHPVTAAIVFGCFWGSWSLLSLFAVVAYFRMSAFAAEGVVRVNGVLRRRTVVLAEVTRARWRGWPLGGSLVLYCRAGRVALGFGNYGGGQELARLFRDTLPADVQQGYERFEAMLAPDSEAFRRRAARERRIATVLMPICAAVLIGYAIWDP